MEDYEEHLYKRLCPVVTSYNYPMSIINKLYKHLEDNLPSCKTESVDTMLHALLINLSYRYDYTFNTEDDLKLHINMFIGDKVNDNTRNGLIARAMRGF